MITKEFIDSLRSFPEETEWIEFKSSYSTPDGLGEYISALSNSACLLDEEVAYLIFGIDDITHEIKGTTFKGRKEKVGNEQIENWLSTQLDTKIDFKIEDFLYDDNKKIVVITIDSIKQRPVSFKDVEYIRIGSYKKKLKEHPEKQAKIWEKCSGKVFENEFAKINLTEEEVLRFIAYPSYFELMDLPLPETREGILEKFSTEGLIVRKKGLVSITNLGAVLFAKNLNEFDKLLRKCVRVIQYKGKNKLVTIKERDFSSGYALAFEEVIKYIIDQLPSNEQIGRAFRKEVKMYPELAIRELVANSLIHQDFRESGTGILIEIYDDRIEISNPGTPLIPINRFIDHNPQSRNEKLAQLMRRIKICEERGSGIDKVVSGCEVYQLPAPNFAAEDNYFKVTLYAYKELKEMDKEDKVRACYQHCCLKYVSNSFMSNQTLRERFAVKEKNYSIISRIIGETVDRKLIKPEDHNNKANAYRRYVPFWV